MFDFEIKFENVIQKNFNIDVFVFRQRVEFLMNVKRECEALWKQTRERAKKNYNNKKLKLSSK